MPFICYSNSKCIIKILILQISNWDGFYKIFQTNVDKSSPKAVAVWISAFLPGIVELHPDPVKDLLKACHTSALKSDEYRFFKPWIGKVL